MDDLERNDIDGALALYKRQLLAGEWRAEDAEMLLMLQDDPTELMARMVQLANEDPAVARALEELD